MKKLMVIAAVALCAICSQAASFNWKTSGIKGVEGDGLFTGTAVFYAMIDGVQTAIGDPGSIAGGAINQKMESTSFVANTTYEMFFVATTEYNGIEYTWTSTTKKSKAQATSSPTVTWYATNFAANPDANANGWVANVPEPTSGLMLLLGMAGLALRRRRA